VKTEKNAANSLFKKITIATKKKNQTVESEDACEDIDLKLGFEIVQFEMKL
jgi:hypothetical protein